MMQPLDIPRFLNLKESQPVDNPNPDAPPEAEEKAPQAEAKAPAEPTPEPEPGLAEPEAPTPPGEVPAPEAAKMRDRLEQAIDSYREAKARVAAAKGDVDAAHAAHVEAMAAAQAAETAAVDRDEVLSVAKADERDALQAIVEAAQSRLSG